MAAEGGGEPAGASKPARLNLVTGGLGFVGRRLVDVLAERGERVRVLDIAEPPEPLPLGIELVKGSILDRGLVERALDGADRLYHLAAIPDLWTRDKADFHRVNTVGTRTVLEAAAAAGVGRVVHTSTESILRGIGGAGGGAAIDETLRATIDDMPGRYCRSKFLAEREALAAAERGLPVVIVNPTLPVGPGDTRLTPPSRMILGFANGDYPAFLESRLNMIHVADVAVGHILAAERGRIGERYILGNENLALSQVLAIIEELTGLAMPRRRIPYGLALAVAAVGELAADHLTRRPPAAPLAGVRLAARATVFDCSKARRELGLPATPVRTALAEALRWFLERGLLRRRPTRPL